MHFTKIPTSRYAQLGEINSAGLFPNRKFSGRCTDLPKAAYGGFTGGFSLIARNYTPARP
jgi:hypothetical protein